jgi:hypothetical protein
LTHLVPQWGGRAYGPVVFCAIGFGIVAAVHAAWLSCGRWWWWWSRTSATAATTTTTTTTMMTLTDVFRAWHGASIATLEIAYILVLCQPLTANRGSPMHIPAEHAYTPLIFAACFVAPKLLPTPHQRTATTTVSSSSGSISRAWTVAAQVVVLLNAVALFVVAGSQSPLTTACGDLARQRRLEPQWCVAVYCVVVFIYAIPMPGSPPPPPTGAERGSPNYALIVPLGLLKASTLCLAVLVFCQQRPTSQADCAGDAEWAAMTLRQQQQHTHDFFRLRVLANVGDTAAASATTTESGGGGAGPSRPGPFSGCRRCAPSASCPPATPILRHRRRRRRAGTEWGCRSSRSARCSCASPSRASRWR